MSAVRKPKAKSSRARVHELSLNQINDATELQPRKEMDLDTLRDYSNAWLDGSEFPPVDVFFDGEVYWLADGFYRVRSARKANLDSIKATVRDGDKRDALLFAAGANATHGVRRTSEDKRKAVLTLLDDAEWCLWSDVEIAKACRVSTGTVSRLRSGSPGVRGHDVRARINADGSVKFTPTPTAPDGVPTATFKRPPVMMSQAEIHDKFVRRIVNHLKKTEEQVVKDFPYAFGTVDIATASTIYAFTITTSASQLYAVVGRLLVARQLINPSATITIVGHFPYSVGQLIAVLRDMNVCCETPEQVLAR